MNDSRTLSTIKDEFRRAAFARRKVAQQGDDGTAALAARDHFLAACLHTGAEIISGYRPIRTEIDVTPLMTALVEAGHRLCVPVIKGGGQPLAFREWTPESTMITGAFGAEVPDDGAWLEPHLLLAPLLAFDRSGWRLGYGGGFYDRTLEKLRAKRRTMAVGFAYAGQEVDDVPHEDTDQRLDAVVTEAGLFRIGQGEG